MKERCLISEVIDNENILEMYNVPHKSQSLSQERNKFEVLA